MTLQKNVSDVRVQRILRNYSKKLDKKSQRAELYSRNNLFREELVRIRQQLGEAFFDLKDQSQVPRKKKSAPSDAEFKKHMKRQSQEGKWSIFCTRWEISARWDGNLRTLYKYLVGPIIIGPECHETGPARVIEIMVTNWATLEDLRDKWGEIEEYQRGTWGKIFDVSNFLRDLCWYDLYHDCAQKPPTIARIWNEHFPNDIDGMTVRFMKKEKFITEADLGGRVLDDATLAQEIKGGFLKDKFLGAYLIERAHYLTGPTARRGNPITGLAPMVGVIRKAIRRMEMLVASIRPMEFDSEI